MAINAEQLNVILTARDREFQRAMDRNTKRIERFAKRSQKQLRNTTTGFNMLAAAAKRLVPAIAAVGAVSKLRQMVETTAQLGDLAAVAGENVERFQELAFAAKTFGVSQEKMADILKDVNDKFGDYVQTGAGPLADFFDNIAPKVGLTADAFKDLSSSDKLGAYIKALEDANVSQADMTFYLEAIASDATLLQRVYANNGAELNRLSNRLRETGGVIDQEIVEKAAKARETIALFSTTINNNAVIAIAGLVEALTNAGNAFSDAEKKATSFLNKIGNFGREEPIAPDQFDLFLPGGKKASEEIARLQAELQKYEQSLADINSQFLEGSFPDSRSFFDDQEFLQTKIASTREVLEKLSAELAAVQKDFAEATDQSVSQVFDADAPEIDLEEGNFVGMTMAAKDLVKEIKDLAEFSGKTAAEQERITIAKEKQKKLDEAIKKLKKEGVELQFAEGQAAVQAIKDSLDLWEQNEIAANRIINPIKKIKSETELAAEAQEKMLKKLIETLPVLGQLSTTTDDLRNVFTTIEDDFTDFFVSIVDGTKDVDDAFRDMARSIIKQLYKVFVVEKLVGSFTDGTGIAGSLGRIISRAHGGTVAAGQPFVAGEGGRELVMPKRPSVVIPAPRTKEMLSGGGDSINVYQTINVTTGVEATVRAEIKSLMPQIAESTKLAVADEKRRGGAYGGVFR